MGRYRLRSLASFLYLLPISCSSVVPAAKSRCCCVQPAALQTTLRLASVPTSIKAATHLDLEVVLTMLAANTPEQQGFCMWVNIRHHPRRRRLSPSLEAKPLCAYVHWPSLCHFPWRHPHGCHQTSAATPHTLSLFASIYLVSPIDVRHKVLLQVHLRLRLTTIQGLATPVVGILAANDTDCPIQVPGTPTTTLQPPLPALRPDRRSHLLHRQLRRPRSYRRSSPSVRASPPRYWHCSWRCATQVQVS